MCYSLSIREVGKIKNRIKQVRLHPKINLSQEAFGKSLGVTGAAISRVESGTRNASEQIILGICREFNVNETWLRTGEGEMFIKIPRNEALEQQIREFLKGGSDSFRERLISLLIRLPAEHWETLERYAQELLGNRIVSTSVSAQNEKIPVKSEPQTDMLAELAELKRQNQEMAAEIAALKEEDAHIDNDELRSILSTVYGQS